MNASCFISNLSICFVHGTHHQPMRHRSSTKQYRSEQSQCAGKYA